MSVIAFDFDGVASCSRIQSLIAKLKREKNEIWIVTKRSETDYNKNIIVPILDKLFLSEHQIIYTKNKEKWELLSGINADIYIDNIDEEFETIKEFTNITPLLYHD